MNIEQLTQQIIKPFLLEEEGIKIGLIPGSFRPPHKGHFELIKSATNENDYTYIVGSSSDNVNIKKGFHNEQSEKIWEIYTKYLKNTKYIKSNVPVVAVYEITNILNNGEHVTTNKSKETGLSLSASEIANKVAKELQSKFSKFIINVYVGDPEDIGRYNQFKTHPDRYSTKNVEKVNIKQFGRIEGTKAEYLRTALKNGEFDRISDFLPKELSDEEKSQVIDLMKKGKLNEMYWNQVSKLKFSDSKNPILDAVLELNPEAKKYFETNKDAEIYFVFNESTAIKLKKKGASVGGKFELDVIDVNQVPNDKPEQVIDSSDENYSEWLSKFYSVNNWVQPLINKMDESELLLEGGSAGHMKHPYDVAKTGKELLALFKEMIENIKATEPAIKIDGINASVRYVNGGFALDRGSSKPLDVTGVKIQDLENRFGAGHGMVKVGEIVLTILDSAVNDIQPELKQLGLLDNPTLMLNLEYVAGKSNVKDYGKNFLAIHNMLSIDFVPGAKRREAVTVDYDKSAMDSLINKVNIKASEQQFEVAGKIPAKLKSEPNLSKVLGETMNIGNENKTLGQYLNDLIIPEYSTKISFVDGTKASPVSDKVFNTILTNRQGLERIFSTEADVKLAIDGFITKYATMVLGEEILKNLDSKLGDVNEQEGVVIRGLQNISEPVKITGRFIIDKNKSPFKRF